MKLFSLLILVLSFSTAYTQTSDLITNISNRNKISLDGKWRIIIDPYEVGYYDYRYKPRSDGYFLDRHAKDKSDLVEYNFDTSDPMVFLLTGILKNPQLFFYEGRCGLKKI